MKGKLIGYRRQGMGERLMQIIRCQNYPLPFGYLLSIFLIVLGYLLFLPIPVSADGTKDTSAVHLNFIDFVTDPKEIDIFVQTDGEIGRYESFTMGNPARIVFDLFDVKSPHKYEQVVPVNTEWVRRIRHYGHPEKLRVVLETKAAYLTAYASKQQKNGLHITVGDTTDAEERVAKPPSATKEPPAEATAPPKRQISDKSNTHIPDPKDIIGDRIDSKKSKLPEQTIKATADETQDTPAVHLNFVDFTPGPKGVSITIQTDGEIGRYESHTLNDPARIVFDLLDVKSPHEFEQVMLVNTDWVWRLRHYGSPEKLRVVLDTEAAYLSAYSSERQKNGLHIVVGQATDAAAEEPVATLPSETVALSIKAATPSQRRISDMVNTHIPDPKEIIGDRIDFQKTDLPAEMFSLEQTIKAAIAANLGLKIAEEETQAAQAGKNRQRADFLPTLGAQYQYTRNDVGESIGGLATGSINEYEFSTTLEQPIFSGFSLINRFKIAGLELDISKLSEEVNRQDIIFQANAAYFNLLKAQKLAVIARQTVNQITAQRDVAKSYLMAGMTPLNSFLQAQVELANAKQESVIAANNIETAITDFNTLLRRPVDIKVELEDITAYKPIERKLTFFQETAEKNRLEIEIADMHVQKAEKDMALSKKDYYPSIDLLGEYFKSGIEWDVAGGEGIFDPEGWSISAMASWNFWEWGKTRYGVKEKLSRLKQARHQRAEILDQIHRQVKQAYLKNLENEINIVTIKTAIDQAKENLRMNQERFKGQAATATDVLIAQTLLTRTMTNYYTALYDFNISKAALYRAVGQKSTSQSTPL